MKTMLEGGSDAEGLSNLTVKVWRNAIYQDRDTETDKFTRTSYGWVDDFNTALANLASDSSTKQTVSTIVANQTLVAGIMKKLQNPPVGLEKCYETVTELYTTYKGFTDMAINPSGSYNSYSDSFQTNDEQFMSLLNKLQTQIPEKK